jgi:hypothetical protein
MARNFGLVVPSQWLGLSLQEAYIKAENDGLSTRVSEIDGKPVMLTMDFKSNRINFRIRGNKIIEAYTG